MRKFIINIEDENKIGYLKSIFDYADIPYQVSDLAETTENVINQEVSTDEPVYSQFQNVIDEPENIDKTPQADGINQDFLKAQLSTKNQLKFRNAMTIVSYIALIVTFILEKLGVI